MKKKVLILEDEVLIANSIQLHLQHNGYEAHLATKPEKAKVLFEEHRFDAVISDINLNAETDGIDFVRDAVQERVPVVYLTAYSDITTLKRAELTHPYAYVTKPFNNDQLLITLNLAITNFEKQFPPNRVLDAKNFDLTTREIEIANLLAKGMNAEKIADELHVSFHTVRTHRKNMLQKLECSNTTELVVKCLAAGVIEY